jgi:hypothetical protein
LPAQLTPCVAAGRTHTLAGTLASSHLRSQLSSKQVRHSLLLAALQEGEVLGQLPAADAAVLLQHAQMLAAAAEVLQWQRSSEAAASSSEDADAGVCGGGECCVLRCSRTVSDPQRAARVVPSGHVLKRCCVCCIAGQREAVLASADAIKAAGSLTAAGRGEAAAPDSQWEVFFGRPTVSIPALFQAVAAEAARIRCAQQQSSLSLGILAVA